MSKRLISAEDAIDAINSHFGFNIDEEYGSAVQEVINALPSAQPTQTNTPNTLKSLDCIDRQTAIDAIERNAYRHTYIDQIVDVIKQLPSAQPDRSLLFRIGEICVEESKWHITAEVAVEKIRALLRAERRENERLNQ